MAKKPSLGPILPGRWKKRPGLDPNRFSVTKAGGGQFVARRYAPGVRFGPVLPGRWEDRPDLDPSRYSITQTGSDKFIARRIIGPKPARPKRLPALPAVTAPAAPPDPYADYPWAKTLLDTITRQGQQHQDYVTQKVQPWAAGVTQGLTGYADTAMQRYLGQLNPVVGAAGQAAAASQIPQVQSTSGGAMVSDPESYLTQAAGQYGKAMGSTFSDIAAHQAALGTLQPASLGQGIVQSLAQYASGLPMEYTNRRAEQEAVTGQFIAEMNQRKADRAEQTRQFDIQRADAELQRQFDRGIAATTLGLDATKAGQPKPGKGVPPNPDGTPPVAPEGYVYVQNADGTYRLVADRSYKPPGGGGGKTAWNDPGKLAADGDYRGPWASKPKIRGVTPFQDTAGKWWVKAPKAGKAPPKGRDAGVLIKELTTLYHGSGDPSNPFGGGRPGWAGTQKAPTPVDVAVRRVANWALSVAPNFRRPDGTVDWNALDRVIQTAVGGSIPDRVLRYFKKTRTGPYASR